MILLSITGVFRVGLILIGVFLLLRLLNRAFVARKNTDWNRDFDSYRNNLEKERSRIHKEKGKVRIVGKKTSESGDNYKGGRFRYKKRENVEDVDFEDL